MPRIAKHELAKQTRRESQALLQQMDGPRVTMPRTNKLVSGDFSGSSTGHGRVRCSLSQVGFRKLMGVVGSEYLSDGLHGSEGASFSVKGTDSLSFCNCAGLLAL